MTVLTRDVLHQTRREVLTAMPQHFERMAWHRAQIAHHQRRRLRSLLRIAQTRSGFHAERLAGVDPDTFELADLPALPVMSKTELMANFDEVVTDPRVTARRLQKHLATVGSVPALFDQAYFVLVSGGSSGVRGTFVYDPRAAGEYVSAVLRAGLSQVATVVGWPPPAPVPVTIVAAPAAIHATRVLPTLADQSFARITHAPVTLPFGEIVDRVQGSQPTVLTGYATAIARLADAQSEGRLRIDPQMVVTTSEQLTPELVSRIAAAFGSPPANSFASSEGLIGTAPPGGDVFAFAGDVAIVEFVDTDDRPVPAGHPADHVLITNLINHTQPLIRYRLDDAMVPHEPAPDHGHARASLLGRTDDYLRLGPTAVHPLVVRSALLQQPGVVEYQVRTDGRRLDIALVVSGAVDLRAIERQVVDALSRAGAGGTWVAVRQVEAVTRDPQTGKAKRFIDMPEAT